MGRGRPPARVACNVLRRPLPHIPRGPRRKRSDHPAPRLLACPRISPEWELSAIQALIKPQTKSAILQRHAQQKWNRAASRALEQAGAQLKQRLGCELPLHLPASGDYHFITEVADADSDEARACALVLSKAVPDLWLVAGRLFVKNGRFYRRQYGYKLFLTPAGNVHLPRALRAALRGCL